MVKVKGDPTVPAPVSGLLEMIGATPDAPTVTVSVALLVPVALVAPSRTEVTPAAVGVPVMAPVVRLTERPAGSGLAEYDVGEFEAAGRKLNAAPPGPAAVSGEFVMTGTPVPVTVKLWRSMFDSYGIGL